jgi:hypothetical protein
MVAFTGTMGYPACPDETTDGLGGAATQNNGTIPESSHKSPEENPSKEHPQQKYKKSRTTLRSCTPFYPTIVATACRLALRGTKLATKA